MSIRRLAEECRGNYNSAISTSQPSQVTRQKKPDRKGHDVSSDQLSLVFNNQSIESEFDGAERAGAGVGGGGAKVGRSLASDSALWGYSDYSV